MAKLYFRYGTMNCGKSSALMQVAHNYNENGKKVLVIKSSVDTKADEYLESRIGLKRKVDILIDPNDSFKNYKEQFKDISCVLVDEAQFLTAQQVDELWEFAMEESIPVICYGLRTDFRGELFEGSKQLMALADDIEELITICQCGKKAKFNARYIDGNFQTDGDTVVIDGANTDVNYKPLCGKCYLEEKKKAGKL